MGFIDEMRALAREAAGSGNGTPDEGDGGSPTRSPVERDLVRRLQGMLGETDPTRWRLLFGGRVQGVGFRWTNQGTANELGLSGWVRNLSDGTVSMEVEGPAGRLIEHLDAVHAYYDRMGCRVWLLEATKVPARADGSRFEVRF